MSGRSSEDLLLAEAQLGNEWENLIESTPIQALLGALQQEADQAKADWVNEDPFNGAKMRELQDKAKRYTETVSIIQEFIHNGRLAYQQLTGEDDG